MYNRFFTLCLETLSTTLLKNQKLSIFLQKLSIVRNEIFLHFSHNEQIFVKVTNMSKNLFKFSDQLKIYNCNFKIGRYCIQIVILAIFHAYFGASSGFKF